MISHKSLTLVLLFAVSSNVVECAELRPSEDRLSSSSMGTGRVDAPVEAATDGSEAAAYSEWQCRPLDTGCSGVHSIASDCDGTPACCPGNIIADWISGANSCKHGASTEVKSNGDDTGSDVEAMVVAITSESEKSASFAVGPSALMTTAALAATMLSYALN